MKGDITIQLFDAGTGEQVQEHKDHNFIAKGVSLGLDEAMRSFLLSGTPLFNRISTLSLERMFSHLVLTDYDGAEMPEKEWLVRGKTIATVSAESASSGPEGGNLNKEESFFGVEKIKFVYDFTTNQSNGEIKSIYLSREKPIAIYDFLKTEHRYLSIVEHGGYYYTLEEDKRTVCKRNSLFEVLASAKLPEDKKHLTFHNGFVYSREGWSNLNVHKIEFDDDNGAEVTVLKASTQLAGLFSMHGELYATSRSVPAYFSVEDDGVNLKEIKQFDMPGLPSYTDSPHYDEGHIFSGYHIFSMADERNKTLFSSSAYQLSGFIGNRILAYNGSKFLLLPKAYIGSRSLLSQPITKTDKQTMKIIYEITLPPLPE